MKLSAATRDRPHMTTVPKFDASAFFGPFLDTADHPKGSPHAGR